MEDKIVDVIYLTKDWEPVPEGDPRMVMAKVRYEDGRVVFGTPVEPVQNQLFLHGGEGSGHTGHAGRPGLVGGSAPRGIRALSIGKNKRSRRTGMSDIDYFGVNVIEKREKAVEKEHERFWSERRKQAEESERRWKSGERYSGQRKRDNPFEDYEAIDHSKPYTEGSLGFPEGHPFTDPKNRVASANEAIQALSYSNMVGYGGALKQAAKGNTDNDLYKTFSAQVQEHGVTLEDVLKVTYFETQGLLSTYNSPDEFLLYHGSSSFKGNYEKVYDIGTEFSGFSSWTSDDNTAASFGNQTLFAPVPRERILVIPSQVPRALPGLDNPLGFLVGGQRNEHEYIVLSDDFFENVNISVKQNKLFHLGGPGSGFEGHEGRPGMVGGSKKGKGSTNWPNSESERIWQWTDIKGQVPVKPLQEISQEKPLAIEKQGGYTKWIVGSVDEQNPPDRMQRSGTMFIRQDSTGVVTSAGYWMDYPEDFSVQEFQRYSSLNVSVRAAEEMKRQKRYGFENDFGFHLDLAKRGVQGWWNNG